MLSQNVMINYANKFYEKYTFLCVIEWGGIDVEEGEEEEEEEKKKKVKKKKKELILWEIYVFMCHPMRG